MYQFSLIQRPALIIYSDFASVTTKLLSMLYTSEQQQVARPQFKMEKRYFSFSCMLFSPGNAEYTASKQ